MSSKDSNTYSITSGELIAWGAASLGLGAAATIGASYRRLSKELAEEGVDPRFKRAILPHAVRALLGSLALTGCAAWAGFHALRSAGMLPKDRAELASVSGGMRTLLPMADSAARRERQQQEQREQQR